jgi:hypothetical protein
VFHEQSHDIAEPLMKLAGSLRNLGLNDDRAIHTGASIRREDECRDMGIEVRKGAFMRLSAFARAAPITYQSFGFRKKEHPDRLDLKGAISRAMSQFLRDNSEYFLSSNRVSVYYDNGQAEITNVLNTLFNAFFFNVKFRRVAPSAYRLFQVADLCCTLELMRTKLEANRLTKSGLFFFRGKRPLKKDYLDKLDRKRFVRP